MDNSLSISSSIILHRKPLNIMSMQIKKPLLINRTLMFCFLVFLSDCYGHKNYTHFSTFRSSHPQMFYRAAILKYFEAFTRKHLRWSLFVVKLQAKARKSIIKIKSHLFYSECCENIQNSLFRDHPRATASKIYLFM